MCFFRDKSSYRLRRPDNTQPSWPAIQGPPVRSRTRAPTLRGKAMPAVTPIRATPGPTVRPLRQDPAQGALGTGGTPGTAAPDQQQRVQLQPSSRPALQPVDEAAEVRAIVRGTVQAAMEVLAGIRPVHQLARRLDPRCLGNLQHRASLIRRELARTGNPALAQLHRNSVVRSVRVCEVADGIYEASAVVVDDVRARAVAVRLERSKHVWRVTELVIG